MQTSAHAGKVFQASGKYRRAKTVLLFTEPKQRRPNDAFHSLLRVCFQREGPTRHSVSQHWLWEVLNKLTDGKVTVRDTRSTYAIWLEDAKIPASRHGMLLGHKPKSMTLHYQSRPVETLQLKEDAEKLTDFLRMPKLRIDLPKSNILQPESFMD